MKALLDTCILIASILPEHPDHADAHAWLSRAKAGAFDLVTSAHSIAEVYTVLTRLPRKRAISADEARKLIQTDVTSYADIVSLMPGDYVNMIDELADNGIIGGSVYDAIIAQAAALAAVDQLVAINVNDFERMWPNHGGRVVSPSALVPP